MTERNPIGRSPKGQFLKGTSGNPKGKPPLSPELKEIKEFTVDELKRIISKFFRISREEVEAILEDKTLPSINHVIASTIVSAIEKGDIWKAEYLFTRSLGKVKDVLEVKHPEPTIIRRHNGEEISLETKRGKDNGDAS